MKLPTFLVFLFLNLQLTASIPSEPLRFENFSSKQGLSNDWVNSITEDDRGFIWIATRNGLNVYDGNKNVIFKFDHTDSNSISFNDISYVSYISSGFVIAGTWGGGLNVINTRTRKVQRVGKNKFEKSLFVKTIIEDEHANIWIGTYGQGVYKFDMKTFALTKCPYHDSNETKFLYNQDMTIHKDTLWIVSRNDGLGYIPAKNGKAIFLENQKLKNVTHITEVDHQLYLGSFHGEVLTYNHSTKVIDTLFNLTFGNAHHNRINSIVEDLEHNVWMSTSAGMFRYSSKTKKLLLTTHNDDNEEFSDNFCSFVDSRGLFWMGTWGGGVNTHFNKREVFKTIELNKEHRSIVQSIHPLTDNIFLLGTSNGLLEYNRFSKRSKRITPKGPESINLTNNIINSIIPFGDEFLITVDGAGLFRMNRDYHISRPKEYSNSVLFNASIIGTDIMNNGDRWIGTWSKGGVFINDRTGMYREFNSQSEKDNDIKCNTVYCALLTKDGRRLIGTEDGVIMYDIKKDQFSKVELFAHLKGEKIKIGSVRSMIEDDEGNLWVACILGLIKFDKNSLLDQLVLTEKTGLINKLIHNMVYSDNAIWATTKNGLIKVNTNTNVIENYTTKDGLPSNTFSDNGTFFNGTTIFFALGNRVVHFDPKVVSKKQDPVKLEFLDLRIDDKIVTSTQGNSNKHISFLDTIPLDYFQNNISFDLSVLDFKAPIDGKFAHKLSGFDKDWIEHDYSETKIRYTNLPGGKYTLQLAAISEDNQRSGIKKTITIEVSPPYWETALFRASIIALLILSFVIALRLKSKRVHDQNKILEQEVTKRTSQLKDSNQQLYEQNSAIESNIRYAAVLQEALFPTLQEIELGFENFFIFNQPKDEVSGDFYWQTKIGNKSIMAVSDCTGHGVSGAFVSVFGISALGSIVESRNIIRPDLILNELHKKVLSAFNQNKNSINDGMDISILCYDHETKTLEVSSAKSSPILMLGNREIVRIKGDKYPIGGNQESYPKRSDFTLKTFTISEPSTVYLFSDGFQDQFGGEFGKKYMQIKFREYLFQICTEETFTQKRLLVNEFVEWKNNYDQVDDVLVVGIQLS